MIELEENLLTKYHRINEIADRQKEIEQMKPSERVESEWMLLQYEAEALWEEIQSLQKEL